MQYRTFEKLDWKPSALGFGAMRLPVIDNDPARIDEPQAIQMIRYAVDHGVNYIDTAYPYHGGHSEPFLALVLQNGYRKKVKLATKLPSWLIESPGDFDRYFTEQLERLQTDHIDFYLLHGLNKDYWTNLRQMGVLEWVESKMAKGHISHLGFSFHDSFDVFKEIVDAYDNWTFCQIQYNYMDVDYQAGKRGLKYAAEKGLGVVIMEPLRGGQLTKNPPPPVARLWATAPRKRTPADWGLQWVWNQPEVSVVLSGMSAMQHVAENIASADRAGVGTLSKDELALIDRVRDAYRKLTPIPCTSCRYCMPCPNGVNIPRILEIYNDATMYNDNRAARIAYQWVEEQQRADLCIECRQCEDLCPQDLPIAEWLKKAHALLGGKE
ncbi:MAG TPA: aldo/keto reductase [Candidatus Heimdallarchaeota archaeon]|nr:aldo/keto reductase [Candidatus Heimdallarchaeota archaeon]